MKTSISKTILSAILIIVACILVFIFTDRKPIEENDPLPEQPTIIDITEKPNNPYNHG